MAASPRSLRKKTWPANLYERNGGYFLYRNPLDGKDYGLGRITQAEAIAEARAVNNQADIARGKTKLMDKISGAADTLAHWLDRYETEILPERQYKPKTLQTKKRYVKTLRDKLGKLVINRVDTKVISDWIDENWVKPGHLSAATVMREFALDVFERAEAKGVIARGTNPAQLVEVKSRKVMRARLSLEAFLVIYTKLKEMVEGGAFAPWAVHAVELAMVSAQRSNDIALMQFRHAHDDALWVEQEKGPEGTQSRVSIPLGLRLNALDLSLREVVRHCRENVVVSRYLVHHTRKRGKHKPGDKVTRATIANAFAAARDATDLTWPAGKTPPTFHEMRSLAERLYKAQGGIDTTTLLGHKHARTTETYHDTRGSEWMVVKL